MFGKCCVCEPAGLNNSDVPVPIGSSTAVTVPGSKENMMPVNTAGGSPAPDSQPTGQTARSEASSLSPEEKTREKMRLQELVKQFARDSLRGVDIRLVLPKEQQAKPAKYRLDASLSWMTFATDDNSSSLAVSVGQIEEVSRWEDLSEDNRQALGAFLSSDEGRNVLHLKASPATQMGGEPADTEAHVLMPDELQKERFVTCIKILRLYCQTSTPAGSEEQSQR